jgi:hypothetical protein
MIGIQYLCCVPLHFLTFMIVIILIMEHACISYASPSRPSLEQALATACSRYMDSHTHDTVTKQFTASSQEYSVSQFMEFILQQRL